MTVVAILAILAALAAPSFTPLIERWRVRQAVEGLQATLYLARSEAIKRGGNVLIEKLPNNTNKCSTASGATDWDCGWQVLACTSFGASGSCVDPTVLQRFDAPANLEVTRTSGGASIRLNRWGLAADGAATGFSVVPQGKATTDASALGVCISTGGRVRVIPPADIPCTTG